MIIEIDTREMYWICLLNLFIQINFLFNQMIIEIDIH